MRPILFELFGAGVPSYYTMMTLGFCAGIFVVWREAPHRGLNPDDVLDLALYMLVAGLLGARLLHVVAEGYFMDYVHLCTDPLQVRVPSFIHVPCALDADCVTAQAGALCNPETLRCHPARDCFAWLKFWHGGLAFLGGLLACIPVAFWFMGRKRMPRGAVLDLGGLAVPLGLGFGRLGCFLSGCCFGQTTSGPLGVQFDGALRALNADGGCPRGYDLIDVAGHAPACAVGRPAFLEHAEQGLLDLGAQHSLAVHPTQLYEAILALSLFVLLYLRRRKVRFAGELFWIFCAAYGVGRFGLEFIRGDADRGAWLGDLLSTSQLLAVPVVAYAAWRIWRGGPAPTLHSVERP